MFNIILRNCKIINPDKIFYSDIAIKGERISLIEKNIKGKAKREIDLKGKLVFPAVIDPHVHFGLEAYNSRTCDDFYSGSISALKGGVTTFIDYAIPSSCKHSIVEEVE
ncbi:MAG: hypothetical protein DRI36_04380, partial [Caldiserica bacterium]